MTIPIRITHEQWGALVDVQNTVNEYGDDVTVDFRGETDITRDKYNSIVQNVGVATPPRYELKAWPVEYQPNRKQVEKAGLREDCQVTVWLATKDLLDRNISFDGIETEKMSVFLDGNEYGVNEKGKAMIFANIHLYITLGLFKRP